MDKKKFNIVVLGGGPGGYVAAIRAAQQNSSVALIEEKDLGGTCLNRGCIPTKTLIANAEVVKKIKHAQDFGIKVSAFSLDFAQMTERKDRIVKQIRSGVEKLMADNKITVIRGHGSFVSSHELKVIGQDACLIEANKIIIATGSEPRNMASFPFDYKLIHDSTSILELTKLPKKLIIIGGGVVGCEFACLYHEMGVEVTIVELLPQILATEGKEIGDFLAQSLLKRGIKIETNALVEQIEKQKNSIQVILKNGTSLDGDMALVAVGRKYNTDQIHLEKALIKVQDNGVIPINDSMQTNISHIYAIGDITGKWLLAHYASHQGIIAADHAMGKNVKMHDDEAVPSVIFTQPEIGTVGLTLEKALEKGYDATIGKFPFQALGKAQALHETDGFAQIVISKKNGQILGAQVVGYSAASLISEMTVAIANELTIESIQETIHAHPTMPEAWQEAAFLATGIPIHYPPKKRPK